MHLRSILAIFDFGLCEQLNVKDRPFLHWLTVTVLGSLMKCGDLLISILVALMSGRSLSSRPQDRSALRNGIVEPHNCCIPERTSILGPFDQQPRLPWATNSLHSICAGPVRNLAMSRFPFSP